MGSRCSFPHWVKVGKWPGPGRAHLGGRMGCVCQWRGEPREGPPHRVTRHPKTCPAGFRCPIHGFEMSKPLRKGCFSYLRVGACRVLREHCCGKVFPRLLEKSGRRERGRESSGVPRRNSGVPNPGRGEGAKANRQWSPARVSDLSALAFLGPGLAFSLRRNLSAQPALNYRRE